MHSVDIVSLLRKGFPKKQVTADCDHFHAFFVRWGGVWRKGNAGQEGIATISNVDFIRMGF